MKNVLILFILFTSAGILASCSKAARCECTTVVNDVQADTIISTTKKTFQSAGKDPTCNDFESNTTAADSLTSTVVICFEV